MKIVLSLFFFLVIFLQITFLPFWLSLAWSLLIVFILVDLPLPVSIFLAALGGFLLDVFSAMFFGFWLITWVSLTLLFFWLAKRELSIERNLASCLAFISLASFVFFIIKILGVSLFSLGDFKFFIDSLLSFEFWIVLIVNVGFALILFFLFNFLNIKEKLNAKRL